MDETRARFLTAIASRVGEARIAEVHLFSPIRQGVLETGVAVVAVTPEDEPPTGEDVPPTGADAAPAGADVAPDTPEAAAPIAPTLAAPALDPDDSPYLDNDAPVTAVQGLPIERHVLYTARYRLTRKGPDRGKWEFDVAATADAPLATADVVARGVTVRAKDVTETERLTGEQVRSLLQEPAWRTAP